MPKIGCKHPCFAPFEGDEPINALPNYGAGVVMGGLVSANLTVNLATGQFHEDDELSVDMSEFTDGTLALETGDMDDNVTSKIYGSTIKDGAVVDNIKDIAPFGGHAYYKTLMRKNNTRYYKAYFYPKVKAILGNDSAQTKTNSFNFTTEKTTFRIYKPNVGDWRYVKSFENETDANAWCETMTNVKVWYPVNIAVSGNGTVSPTGTHMIPSGEDAIINVGNTPTKVYDNGVDVTASIVSGVLTISAVSGVHNVVVIYEQV